MSIDIIQTDGVLTLTLRNEAKRNALSPLMLQQLATAAVAVRNDPLLRCVVITGAGAAFCSGGDLDALGGANAQTFRHMERLLDEATAALSAIPVPVLALINGACFGAGVQLALAADIRMAAETMRLGIPAARIGLVYPPAAIAALVRLAGAGQAARLLLSGQTIDAAEALTFRLVEQVVPADQLFETAAKLVERLAAVPEAALKAYTAIIRQAALGADVSALQRIQSGAHTDAYLGHRLSLITRK